MQKLHLLRPDPLPVPLPVAFPLILFFLKGQRVSVNLVRNDQYVFDEPVECVLGVKNEDPDEFLSWSDFCDATLPVYLSGSDCDVDDDEEDVVECEFDDEEECEDEEEDDEDDEDDII